MSLIQVQHLSYCYDESYESVFEDVSFSFDTNYKCALIGRNGRGKTTFLKILMNELKYQGRVIKSIDCEYFPYTISHQDDLVIDICFDIVNDLQQWQLEKELRELNMNALDYLYRPFSTLSMGEKTKILLAVLFLKQEQYLLIDEPTNHLDQQSRFIVAKYLQGKNGFLLVSHDRGFIDMCCDHVIALNRNSIEVVSGNFSSWYENKMNKDMLEQQQNKKIKKDIARLEESRRQSALWSDKVEKTKNGQRVSGLKPDKGHIGHMAAKMMKRSKNVEKRKNEAIVKKQGLLKDIEIYDDLKISSLSYHRSLLISFSHVDLFYQQRCVFHDLSFEINQGERVLLKGKNGCGKSSVISLIMHHHCDYQGEIYIGNQLKISYVPQDCSHLQGSLDTLIEQYDVDQTLVKSILRKLDFSRSHFEHHLENLSYGQKKKIMLAISLATKAHIYIWDEPLNYIDIYSRIQIENLILQYQPTLLLVEHDSLFQEKIATKVIDFDMLFDKSEMKLYNRD
jgi:ATPase components of ABC transporters with duplicated ATPase domains